MDPNAQPQAQLDPSVVALTKAIGQAESGGKYNQPSGDPGSAPSAYQFTPGFVQKWAPKILGNGYDPTNLNPAQQDELAYGAVKTMGTSGDPDYSHLGPLSPAQVASDWNAGDPNAYLDPEYGKNNAYGSTENYVNKVGENYQKNIQESGVQQSSRSNSMVDTANAATTGTAPKSSTPNLDTTLLGGLGLGAGIIGLLAWLGGPEVGAPVDAALLGGEGAATAGEAAAGTEAATNGGGIIGTLLKSLGIGGAVQEAGQGVSQAVNAVKGILNPGGTPATGDTSSGSASPSSNGTDMSDLLSLEAEMPQSTQASKSISQSVAQALGATPTGRAMLNSDPNVQQAVQTAGIYGLPIGSDQNGNLDTSEGMKKADQSIGTLSKGLSQSLMAEGTVIPIQEAVSRAKEEVRQHAPSNEWAERDAEIDRQAKTYSKNFGDGSGNISIGHLEQMRKEMGNMKWSPLDTNAKRGAHKALYFGARRTVEKYTKNKELYNRAMKEEQKLINAKKIYKRLNGKKAPVNKNKARGLLHFGGRYAALALGDKIGGPMGAILGDMIGKKIINAVDKKFGKTIFETPTMHKALELLKKDKPAIYKRLELELKKEGIAVPTEKKKDFKEGILPKLAREKAKKKKKPHNYGHDT